MQITGDPNAIPQAGPPSRGFADATRNALGQPQSQQMCALPDGNFVRCSEIANPGGAQNNAAGATSPQGAPPPIGTQNTTPFAAGTCSPTFYCSDNNLYYRSSTCVDQVNQVCPDGCEANACKGSRQNVSDLLGSALSGTTTGSAASSDASPTSSLSTFDKINQLIDPSAANTATSVEPVILTQGVSDATRLQGGVPNTGLPPGTVFGSVPLGAQQTFTSGDLMESRLNPQELTGFQATLASIRERLERITAYLRPFGRPIDEEHNHFE